MRINTPSDGRISIDDSKQFVEKEDVAGGEKAAAYTIGGPRATSSASSRGRPSLPRSGT